MRKIKEIEPRRTLTRSPLFRWLYVIEIKIPDNSQDDADKKEKQTDDQQAVISGRLGLSELALTVLIVGFVMPPSHRNEDQHHISHDKTDSKQCSLSADKHQAGEKHEQNTGNRESVRKDLQIHTQAICEKASDPDYDKRNQRSDAGANKVFSQ